MATALDPDQPKKQKILVEEMAPLKGVQEQQVRHECEVTKPEKEKASDDPEDRHLPLCWFSIEMMYINLGRACTVRMGLGSGGGE
ncbi:hypothetical protein G5576_110432 [Homo sapiens]|uniref:Uncharacterized protein n=1 Tax=Homo sapiens TaxID=9606 RepID=A0A087WXM4_HUMAN|nr:hypothetical protein KI723_060382 [Homo sapiens]KAI4017216.1 hypothetical protein G5576_110432 [Homo sapiens]